ncbi:MAG: hypothetical protein AAGN15_05250 [Cyanobacteria bacterium J06581_3]
MQPTPPDGGRKLPLSHTIYRDDEIDADKAEQLIVYHYPLAKSYRWKEWQAHLDTELSDRYYPYLMRSYRGQFGLFVALDSVDDKPPIIKNRDDIIIEPERIRYDPKMNPIWIRLIMRKAAAFGSHCKGSHKLGRPLLKIDVWQGKKSTGINAISLDCRTQQLADKNTTEIVLFYENVPLRPVAKLPSKQSANDQYRKSLWTYGKNKVLVRWIPTHGEKTQGTVYEEIQKRKNKRRQRAFIDLSSAKALKLSWPYILKSVQDELIEQAKVFGFKLRPKVLKLRPLPHKTKYKSNPSTRSLIPSMDLDTTVDVLDLRKSNAVPASEILRGIQQALEEKGLGTQLNLLPSVELDNVAKIDFDKNQRLLILLDQLKGVVDDRYPVTKPLHSKFACQHINVNPNDLIGDSVAEGLLIEQSNSDDGKTYLIPEAGSKYYDYDLSQFEEQECQEALKRKSEIVIKELELKHLLLSDDARISTSLPEQQALLTEELVVITNGYLFTVSNDRPIMLPFNPATPNHVEACNNVLKAFDMSVRGLLELLQQKWPYSYRPQAVMQGFGSPEEKLNRFAHRLTIVIHKSDRVSVSFQDPKYETPHMLPSNLDRAIAILESHNLSLPLVKWQLPQSKELITHIEQLANEGEITHSYKQMLLKELNNLCDCWYETLREVARSGSTQADYKKIRKGCSDRLLQLKNSQLGAGQKSKLRNSPTLISSWTKLLSRVFDLPLQDVRVWLRNVPGIERLWHDPEEGYYIVGGLTSPKRKISRQPSIRQWHALQGKLDTELLTALVDVDWVRTNQLAGNPCVATLINRWKDCQSEPDEALLDS